jgi:hypothetical protein
MAAIRRTFVLGLAVLLAAATAVADTVTTAEEILVGTVGSADISFLDLKLPQGGTRIIYTRDILEVRMPDSIRVAELAAQLPQVRVTVDSGQPIPPRDVRAHEMLRLRMDRAREARAGGLAEYAETLDTLSLGASPGEMSWRCREMRAVLRECGRSNRTVARLLREVNGEAEELAKTPPKSASYFWGIACCGLLGGSIAVVGGVEFPQRFPLVGQETPWEILRDVGCGVLVGAAVGVIPSLLCGPTVGKAMRASEIKQHRARVNDLVRRVNRAVVAEP